MPFISIILIIAAALFAAAFFYVSRIISSLPKGRAEEQLQIQDSTNKKLIACIGDSLTHGNIGQSWVDYLRNEFPNDIFLNEGINGNTVWQVLQRVEPLIACKPDIIVILIGSNDALGSFDKASGQRYKRNYNLPEAPTFEKYKDQLLELIEKLSDVSKVALCTIPPVGENRDSPINNHVRQFNEFIKFAAEQKMYIYCQYLIIFGLTSL